MLHPLGLRVPDLWVMNFSLWNSGSGHHGPGKLAGRAGHPGVQAAFEVRALVTKQSAQEDHHQGQVQRFGQRVVAAE